MRRIKRLELQLKAESNLRNRQVGRLRRRVHELEENVVDEAFNFDHKVDMIMAQWFAALPATTLKKLKK